MEIRKLWTGVPDEDLQQITWPSTITSNMPTTTLVTTTPSTTTTTSRAPSRKNQSARVTAPETVKAMGFTVKWCILNRILNFRSVLFSAIFSSISMISVFRCLELYAVVLFLSQ